MTNTQKISKAKRERIFRSWMSLATAMKDMKDADERAFVNEQIAQDYGISVEVLMQQIDLATMGR